MSSGFVRETLHFDRPVTPLFATLIVPAIEQGLRRSWAAHGPSDGVIEMRVFDSYVYTGWTPQGAAPAIPAGEGPELGEIAALWGREHLPEIRALQEELALLLPPHAPLRRVRGALERLDDAMRRQYERHYDATVVMNAAWRMLEGFARSTGDPNPAMSVALMLAPSDSILRETDEWMARLASEVAKDARASGLLTDPARFVAFLSQDSGPAGETFRSHWDAVADRPGWLDIAAPTWREDPAPLVRLMRAGADAHERFRRATRDALARRDEAEAAFRARLPAEAQGQVAPVLAMVRQARGLHQTMNHLVGERALGIAHGLLLRAGARLVEEGVIAAADDVFFLERDELLAWAEGAAFPRGVVDARRKAHELAARTAPPDVVGEVPAEVLSDPRLVSLLGVRRGAATGAATLKGLGASPGAYTGAARVVREDAELDDVQEGEILIVMNLAPNWTPAMLKAGAIATETGGLLCHAAIVAREMARPAVVGVGGLLAQVKTGGRLVVDGDRGEVRRG